MTKKAYILILLLALLFLAGCKGGGEGTMSSSTSQYYAYNDGGDMEGGDIDRGDEYDITPEPATLALFGSGLLGLASYVLAGLKRKK